MGGRLADWQGALAGFMLLGLFDEHRDLRALASGST
jgi:hypothetical protein